MGWVENITGNHNGTTICAPTLFSQSTVVIVGNPEVCSYIKLMGYKVSLGTKKKLPDARKLLEGEVVFQATMVSDCSMPF